MKVPRVPEHVIDIVLARDDEEGIRDWFLREQGPLFAFAIHVMADGTEVEVPVAPLSKGASASGDK